jgi:hypothetical protein
MPLNLMQPNLMMPEPNTSELYNAKHDATVPNTIKPDTVFPDTSCT